MTYDRAKALLNITAESFTMDDVKRARKTRMFEVHPDRNPALSAMASAAKVQEVSDAFAFFQTNGTGAPAGRRGSGGQESFNFNDLEEVIRRGFAGGIDDPIGEALRYVFEQQRRKREAASAARRAGQDAAASAARRAGQDAAASAARRAGQDAAASAARRAGQDAAASAARRAGQDAAASAARRARGSWTPSPSAPPRSRARREHPRRPSQKSWEYTRIRAGRHVLKFIGLSEFRPSFAPDSVREYHFEVIQSVAHDGRRHHVVGEEVTWTEGRFGFHPAREWQPGETIIATIDEDIGRDILLTEEQVKEQKRVRETVFKRAWSPFRTADDARRAAEEHRREGERIHQHTADAFAAGGAAFAGAYRWEPAQDSRTRMDPNTVDPGGHRPRHDPGAYEPTAGSEEPADDTVVEVDLDDSI